MWEKAENSLREVLNEMWLEYTEEIWEAAFYGPKLDVNVKPAIWNEYTLSTCQLDFCLPAKFDLKYTDKDWEKKTPIVLHRAILWAIGRFFAYLIEETKWNFPFWLAPEQVKIVPVADPFIDYANKVCEELAKENIRVSVDTSDDSLNKKIRNAELMKIPYILIVGEKEVNSNWVSVRVFKTKEQYEQPLNEFVKAMVDKINTKALD
jgi:threonyl-tRNA synthetase